MQVVPIRNQLFPTSLALLSPPTSSSDSATSTLESIAPDPDAPPSIPTLDSTGNSKCTLHRRHPYQLRPVSPVLDPAPSAFATRHERKIRGTNHYACWYDSDEAGAAPPVLPVKKGIYLFGENHLRFGFGCGTGTNGTKYSVATHIHCFQTESSTSSLEESHDGSPGRPWLRTEAKKVPPSSDACSARL
jgi:hypothetical protein